MTEAEKWAALRKTALTDHEPFCNYGSTNGREMCTCQVLVDLVEGTDDEPEGDPVLDSGAVSRVGGASRSEQRARRLAQRRAASKARGK